MEPVRNHRNKIVVAAARLHRARFRDELHQTLIEGPHLIGEALASGADIETVFALEDDQTSRGLAKAHGLRFTLVDERALDRLAGTKTPRGPVAVVNIPTSELASSRSVLVSVGISDPGNTGALIRTAAGFGWSFAHVEGSADPWSPKSLRAGAGGQFQTSVVEIVDMADLRAFTTLATVVDGGIPPDQVAAERVALLIGAEASGLGSDVIADADIRVTIPIADGTESLNAGVAAGIIVYELSKRTGPGHKGV